MIKKFKSLNGACKEATRLSDYFQKEHFVSRAPEGYFYIHLEDGKKLRKNGKVV